MLLLHVIKEHGNEHTGTDLSRIEDLLTSLKSLAEIILHAFDHLTIILQECSSFQAGKHQASLLGQE